MQIRLAECAHRVPRAQASAAEQLDRRRQSQDGAGGAALRDHLPLAGNAPLIRPTTMEFDWFNSYWPLASRCGCRATNSSWRACRRARRCATSCAPSATRRRSISPNTNSAIPVNSLFCTIFARFLPDFCPIFPDVLHFSLSYQWILAICPIFISFPQVSHFSRLIFDFLAIFLPFFAIFCLFFPFFFRLLPNFFIVSVIYLYFPDFCHFLSIIIFSPFFTFFPFFNRFFSVLLDFLTIFF